MLITIKRDTGLMGSASKIQIKVNGEKLASVMDKQHIAVDIPHDKANVKVTQFGVKSNEVEVKDGDTLKITSTTFNRLGFPLLSIIVFLTFFIPVLKYKLIAIITAGVLIEIGIYLIDGFHLEVLKKEINNVET